MNKINDFNIGGKVGINTPEFDSMPGNDLKRIINYEVVETVFDEKGQSTDEEEIQEFFRSKAKLFEPNLNDNKIQTKNKRKIKLKYTTMNSVDILKIREELEMTQQKFAERIGVDRRTIINWEQGKNIPDSKVKLLNQLLEDSKTKDAKPEEFNNLTEKSIEPSNEYELKYISQLEAEIAELKRELFFYKSGGVKKI